MNIVKELRKKKGIQQKDLAIIVGVSQPTVSEWESLKKDPSGERLKKLADYFEVDELVVLGKSVIDLTNDKIEQPHSIEARILARGIDKLPQEQREQALAVMRAMFAAHADFFNTEDQDDDS